MDNDVDIVVTGRHTQITERFRTHLEEKLSKVPHLLPRVSRIDVVVTHEKAVRNCDAVEITCYAKGPVIRAEACTDDLYASLDIALDKLFERLRRSSDRRRVSRTGRRVPESVARAIFDGVENDEDDIFPDAMSASMADGWRSGPAKALERQYAALATAERAKAQANSG